MEVKYRTYNDDPDESHAKVLQHIPPGSKVLEIGSSTGYLTERLEARGCEVYAVEPNPDAVAIARTRCKQVHCGYVEEIENAETRAYFEQALLVDVLEHVVERDTFMMTVMSLLRPNGRVVISIPNIAHWTARYHLFRGRFPYQPYGLFDDTHVRFYTRDSLEAFLSAHGLRVISWDQTLGLFEYWKFPRFCEQRWSASWRRRKLLRLACRWWPRLFAYQFVVVAERSSRVRL